MKKNFRLVARESTMHDSWNYDLEDLKIHIDDRGYFYTSYIAAKDADHALKICYDAIAKKKAELAGL